MRKHYKIAEDMKPYLHPLQAWNTQQIMPNLQEITDPLEALRLIGWSTPNVDYYNAAVMLPNQRFPTYCKLFLNSVPGGSGWDGSGLILTKDYPQPKIFTFALCKHEKTEEGHNPNHGRGWHPGHCKHCNMDMSVDSGD
jgi:hypothetical protein